MGGKWDRAEGKNVGSHCLRVGDGEEGLRSGPKGSIKAKKLYEGSARHRWCKRLKTKTAKRNQTAIMLSKNARNVDQENTKGKKP